MRAAMTQLNVSARAYHRILKLARTIADLAGSEEIQSVSLAEALHASRQTEAHDDRINFFVRKIIEYSFTEGVMKCCQEFPSKARPILIA